jgi:hypothetical protein
MNRLFALIFALVLLPGAAFAQLGTVPNTFTTGVNDIDDLNENFTTAYSTALNRTGGTMTGTLTSQALVPATTAVYDLGTTLVKYRDGWFSRNLDVAGSFAITGTISDPDSAVAVADQFTATSTTSPQLQIKYDTSNYLEFSVSSAGAVTVNAAGASQAVTFSDAVTISTGSIAEAAITDGSLLARNAGTETITGTWDFTNASLSLALTSVRPAVLFVESGATADEGHWWFVADGDTFSLQTLSDINAGATSVFSVNRTGTVVDAFTVSASQFAVGNGTESLPSITFASDNNTGIYRVTTDTLGITSGGSTRIYVGPTGVFIGATSVPVYVEAGLALGTFAFATLPGSQQAGTILYCSDCTIASPCAGGGSGAIAKRLNGAWVCN